MEAEDKVVERKILLRRVFPRHQLFEIGRKLAIPYFERFENAWGIDAEQAAFEIASAVGDARLKGIFDAHKPRKWTVFRGKYYTFEDGALSLKGSWEAIKSNIHHLRKKYGESVIEVLKVFLEAGKGCSLIEVSEKLKRRVDPAPIVADLERFKVLVPVYEGDDYKEWGILEEVSPLVRMELGLPSYEPALKAVEAAQPMEAKAAEGEVDYVALERQEIERMDNELNQYLSGLLKNRLDATIKFGKTFSMSALADYLIGLFGPVLYFDSLLSITQQYGLADVEIVHERGKTGMRTGWNLALFGEPGTGKSFSTRDMILGKPDAKIPAHGVPGRNRYAAGMTPARFIRIGQAYTGKTFNFIIPEFNDWFKYKGMVEPLKLAMERGVIKYELHREVIGPYKFSGFFSVNYNVATFVRGYDVTISDPNFSLPYDEPVLVYGPRGFEFVKIGELAESKPANVKVVSFNPETLKVELCEITGYFKHPASRIYEVRLRSGRRVRVTAGHSLFTISSKGEVCPVCISRLKPGDLVAIPRRLPLAPKPLTELNVACLLYISGLHGVVFVKEKGLKRVLSSTWPTLRALSRQVNRPYSTVCYWKKNSMLPLCLYARFDPDFSRLSHEATIFVPKGRGLPAYVRLDEEFAWFLGFYVAEGDIHKGRYVRLRIKDAAYAGRVKSLAGKLGLTATYDGKVVVINSMMLAKLLLALGVGRFSYEKRIPTMVFNMNEACIKAFVEGYFAGDGYLNRKRGEISAATVSEQLPSDEMYLLLFLGKIARAAHYRNYTLITVPKGGGLFDGVPAKSIQKLVKMLREKSKLSQNSFLNSIGDAISRSCLAEIEIGYHNRVRREMLVKLLNSLNGDLKDNVETKILESLVFGDLAWDEVKEVVDTGCDEVTYDLEVRPGGRKIENFLGGYGGVFLHNSAIEDRMLCRLHRLTKERFVQLAQSQRRLALGEIDIDRGAKKIRDHLALVYAIETGHPLVRERFPKKPVLVTPKTFEVIERARNAIL
ncbi:MAG: LAGLIDADG family homing endonuclease, partial [Nitrososphaerota archaeon]|nr:LAGLIDADG family homing endonuclease [Nitrososphaerota archaeon]